MTATKKKGPATRKFRCRKPYYRLGEYYTPGDIIEVPDGDPVSEAWVPLEGESAATADDSKAPPAQTTMSELQTKSARRPTGA